MAPALARGGQLRPLSGVKRTSAGHAAMFANDPKRTLPCGDFRLNLVACRPLLRGCTLLFELL
jgi:hypothetical protein